MFQVRINNEILRAVKETAVDCNIHSTSNGDKAEDYVCYGSGMVESNNFSSHPTLDKDSNIKDGLDMKTISWKGVRKNINGVDYAMNQKTRQLYNLDSFRRAQKQEGDLIYVGKYEIHNVVTDHSPLPHSNSLSLAYTYHLFPLSILYSLYLYSSVLSHMYLCSKY